jgi:hypothetical protein
VTYWERTVNLLVCRAARALRAPSGMTRISISPAAFHAICSMLPEDAPLWPARRLTMGRMPPHGEAAALGPRLA